jgi:ADP-ribosyl-[dinitrogen reductase] hydrolase
LKLPFLRRLTGNAAPEPSRPFPNSYWVEPGRLIAGEYPGAAEPEQQQLRIERLVAAGVGTIVDLTEPHEREPYAPALPAGVEHERRSILDHGLPYSREEMQDIVETIDGALRRNRVVYVHCNAGIGRTGMAVGCWLVSQGRTGEDAFKELNRLWKQCARSTDWKRVPETEEQQSYVRQYDNPDAQDPLLDGSTLGAAKKLRDRFLGAMLGLAVGDALAAPTQMGKPGAVAPVADLLGGGPYDLPRGAWTDDTAMALCLAESLLEARGFDPRDQVARYVRWQKEGYLSATGECLGITAATSKALAMAQWRRQAFGGSHDPKALDPEALARIAPAVLYFFADRRAAMNQAAEAARATSQVPEVLAASRFVGAVLHAALSGQPKAQVLPVANAEWTSMRDGGRLVAVIGGSYRDKEAAALKPRGGAADVLECALWAFHRSGNFRDGALAAVNLGGHSDVIGALYGQLAGAHYGVGAIPVAWRRALARHDLLSDLTDRLLAEAMVGLGEAR